MQCASTRYLAAALVALFLAFPALSSDLEGETLLQNLPSGYRIALQTQDGTMGITEMVPQSESVQDWTEMLTTQLFFGMKQVPPLHFQSVMASNLQAACAGGESTPVTDGDENGYPFALWWQVCPLNPSTGKPEYTWFKAIQGNERFYVVQKAFRFAPSSEQTVQWGQYLEGISLCDTRLPDRACPQLQRVQ